MILNEFFNNPDLAEGAEFGAYYSEQVAQQIFDQRQDISSEDEVLNQAYHIVANDQGQKSARYMFNYDADFPSDVVSNYFHLQKQGVAEAGPYGSRNPDTMSPGNYDRYQQDQMDQSKRDFKRQEHDAEWEQEKAYSAKLAAQQAGPWYIRLNGKLLRDKTGNPYTFNSKAAANKAALTMQAKLFNQGKEFMLTTNPNDPQQGVAEEKVRLDPKCWTGKKIGNPKTKMKGDVRVNNCVPAGSVEEAQEKNKLDEVSTELLARYKTGAAADAKKADAAGDYKRGDTRFSGIVKATNKQFANDLKKHSGVAEGWQEDSQELEDWSKEVNKRLYRAHESQRPALARQLSKIEQKQFGSSLNQGSLTELVHSALKALRKGDMVHYDPQSVGQMPFGNIVGDDARIIASSGLSKYDVTGYRGLQRAGIVDTIEQFLHLRDLADNQGQAILKYANMPPVAAWMQFIKDIGWSKDDMNEEVQAKTDDKLLAYYAQRKAEKQKQQQGATATSQPVEGQPKSSSFQAKPMSMSLENWKKEILAKYPNAQFATERRPNGSTLAGELGGGRGQGGLGIYSPSTGEVRVGPTGAPSQPLRIHPKQQDVLEGSQRVDSIVTDALKIMRGSELSDAVAALKTVLGDREYNGRRGHYNFYVRQLMDMYSQQGVAEEVDTGQYDARKSNAKGATTPDQEKSFREKIKQYSKELEQRQKQKEQGVAEADMSRRGFLKGLGAAAMAGAAGGAMAQSNQQQDLGNGFVLTTIDVAGHTVKAVLDTQSGLSFTLNRGSNGSAIIRSQARFLTIKDGKIVDASMSVGPATTNAMKKAGLVQEGVAEGLDDNVPADRGEYDQEGEMAQQDLTTAVDAAEELRSILSADENLPEWVQAKITKAVDYLDTTRDYMKSKEPELNESRLHRLNLLKTIMIQTP